MKPKVVFDTNIYISAILFGGAPRLCLDLARKGSIKLCTSKALLLELATKLTQKFGWSNEETVEVLLGITKFAKIVSPTETIDVIKVDPSDNRVLETAVAGKADIIVTGDKRHLLPIKSFKGISIVTAAQFLKEK